MVILEPQASYTGTRFIMADRARRRKSRAFQQAWALWTILDRTCHRVWSELSVFFYQKAGPSVTLQASPHCEDAFLPVGN
jgi:hypothetical protein